MNDAVASFHEILFPLDISSASRGGPERRTEVVVTGSGREQRNARWAHARRRYNAGYGVTTPAAAAAVLAFFEERRGRLYGFRWRDRADFKSCAPDATPGPLDQTFGLGDGATRAFRLTKTYGALAPYVRAIAKPVDGSVRVAVDGREIAPGDATIDPTSGIVIFRAAPAAGAVLTAGFLFDTPVRFDTDRLDVEDAPPGGWRIRDVPLVELRLP
jgi:uncharacterized protein (TIGR02217 family)